MVRKARNATRTTTESCNPGCNGLEDRGFGGYLSPAEKRIYDVISKSSQALFPKDIATELHMKLGTVRPALRRMLDKRRIKQPCKGAYCDPVTYDVRFHPLLVHNVRLHFCVEEDLIHWESEVSFSRVFSICRKQRISRFCARNRREVWLIWDNDGILPYYTIRYPEDSIWFGGTATHGHSYNSAY